MNAQTPLTTEAKALALNLDPSVYGTIAEIGAGQEVARQLFAAGAASGTIAKTMSAYDMIVSDEIYGSVRRYVSRDRLLSMLDHEYPLLVDRLNDSRGPRSRFFAFADTVAARNYEGTNECHGWTGIRFQTASGVEPSEIILHLRMLDPANVLQQEALGIFGVNLIYGAYNYHQVPEKLIESLADNIGTKRIEVEAIEFNGPAFEKVDQRSLNLALLEHKLANAVMFGPDQQLKLPSEELYKRPVVLLRGSFRPVTKTHIDMLEAGLRQFKEEVDLGDREPLVVLEMTVQNLLAHNIAGRDVLLDLADSLLALNHDVLITDYREYYRLSNYLRRYTQLPIAILIGVNNLFHLFDKKFYTHLNGGILEGFGRLFREKIRLYVQPMARTHFEPYFASRGVTVPADTAKIVTADNLSVAPEQQGLFHYLRESNLISSIKYFNKDLVNIHPSAVREQIRAGESSWKECVPAKSAKIIAERGIFDRCG